MSFQKNMGVLNFFLIYLLINHIISSYNGYYKIINSANIKKTKPISILAEFMNFIL